MNPGLQSHTLVFFLSGLERLEAVMGEAATQSRLGALSQALVALVSEVLRDEAWAEAVPDLPRGMWANRFGMPERAADAQADKFDAIRAAATELGMALAQEVFGAATARLAGFRVALLPNAPAARELARLCAAPPADLAAERALSEALAADALRTFLQPIVRFPGGETLGYEALTRGPAGSPIERADRLFGAAARCGLTARLETTCALSALRWAECLAASEWLSINISPLSLADSALRKALAHPGIVVELTEHLPLTDAHRILPQLAPLRVRGALLSLDDTGCGYADMQAVQTLRPDFVKLCITIVKSVARDPETVLASLAETIAYLKARGIGVLAEGVETAREAELLATLPIDYAQGWLYGKPRPAAEIFPEKARS
ncbi:MAG: EAL domain-containing protein [Zoogloeaceae bacterium]|nr:EAL domain-containing protein [Zoogloeaceae bacterium]